MTDLKSLCCICLQPNDFLLNLFENKIGHKTFLDKLNMFVPNLAWSKAFKVCDDCAEYINSAYDFVEKCSKHIEIRQKEILKELNQKNFVEDVENTVVSEGEHCNSIKCNICVKKFKTNRALKTHLTKIHVRKKVEEQDGLKDKRLIELNLDLDSNELDKIAERKEEVKRSVNQIKPPLKCEYCGKDFNRKQHLLEHIRRIHTHETPYHCNLCEAKFAVSQSLLTHKRKHFDDRRYVCTYCGKKFLSSTYLINHTLIHTNKRGFKCEPCKKSFNTPSILRIHRQIVHTDPMLWKYVCSYCERRFPISTNLKSHMRRHTGEKNFSCTICGKAFYDNKILQNHYRSHTNEREFKCNLCGKEYKENSGLHLHMKRKHKEGYVPKPLVKKFSCHVCLKCFPSPSKLRRHVSTHTGEKLFNCDLCKKSFNDRWYKKIHMEKEHSISEAGNKSVLQLPAVFQSLGNPSLPDSEEKPLL